LGDCTGCVLTTTGVGVVTPAVAFHWMLSTRAVESYSPLRRRVAAARADGCVCVRRGACVARRPATGGVDAKPRAFRR